MVKTLVLALVLGTSPAEESSATELRFFDLLEEALEKNPELQSYERRAQAALDRADAQAAFPDPVVGFSVHDLPVPSFSFKEDMMTMSEAMVSQRFPWFGKRDLRRRSEGKAAEVIASDQAGHALQLTEALAEAYAKLWLAHNSRELLAQQTEALERLVTLTRQGLSVGSGRQADLYLAEAEAARLSQRLVRIEEEEASARAALAALVARETPVGGAPASLPSLPLPELETLMAELDRHPQLEALRREREAFELQAQLARKEKIPDPEISLSYAVRVDHPDMVGFGVSLPIPIFGAGRADRLAAAASAAAQATERRISGRRDALVSAVRAAYAQAQAERERERLYEEEILPAVRQSARASAAAYVAGAGNLLTVLDQERNVFALEMERLEARAASFVALVRLASRAGDLGSLRAAGEE